MTFTAEQKSQLARLMATENLTVQHQKIQTAKFDPKNRVLYLPIWQNMTGAIYDLLCGHEVGHALYTPADGWHNTASDKSKGKFYKNFLNVVEDARIEKKVKRKYPGLNNSFRNGYQELINRDFFGIKGTDVNKLSFIDRLNLYSKSQWTNTKIEFSAKEELLVKKVQACESWDDVVRATDEVYAYSKDEQMEMKLQYFEELEAAEGNDFNNEIDSDYEFEEYDDEENSAEADEEVQQMLYESLKPYLPEGFTYNEFTDDSGVDIKKVGKVSSYKVSPTIADDIKQSSFWAILGSLIVFSRERISALIALLYPLDPNINSSEVSAIVRNIVGL